MARRVAAQVAEEGPEAVPLGLPNVRTQDGAMASVLRLSVLGMLVWGLSNSPTVNAAASVPSKAEADTETAYVLGAIFGASLKKAAEYDAVMMLRRLQIGAEFVGRICAGSNPELAASIAAEWSKSRLGSATFAVNGQAVLANNPSPNGQWAMSVGNVAAQKGVPECSFFPSYLLGIEEALPAPVQALLGMPTDWSPYSASSRHPMLRVLIGHAGPTSGVIAHLGQDNENGARLAVEELNTQKLKIQGKPVRFMLMPVDDEADPRKATAVANKLVESGVKAVIGHLNSGISIPASRIYRDAGIPMISPASTNPWLTRQGFPAVFRMLLDDEYLGKGLAQYAKDVLHAKRIAIIRDGTAYGDGLSWAFDVEAHSSGLEVVSRERTSDKATEFTDILQRIKASTPDLVFFGGMDAVAGPLLKQMKAMGIGAKLIGGDGICSTDLPVLAGEALGDDQVICAEAGGTDKAHEEGMKAFRRRFQTRFAKPVQVYAPYAYDATRLVAHAMVQAQSVEPATYLPSLKATRGFEGVAGSYSFDRRGDPIEGWFTVYTYRKAKRMEIRVQRFVQPLENSNGGEIRLSARK